MSTFAAQVTESAERLERMGTMARAVLDDIAQIRAEEAKAAADKQRVIDYFKSQGLEYTDEPLEQEDEEYTCHGCSGSGEGMHEGTNCRVCGGSGVVR